MNASLTEKVRTWFREGFVPVPIDRVEWIIMRTAFAVLILITLYDPHPFEFPAQPAPVGIARFVNLSWLHHDGVRLAVISAATALGGAYALGIGLRVVLPLLTLIHIIVRTYYNSQGFTHHGEQLISMVLIAQSLVIWWKGSLPEQESRAWLWFYSRGIVLFSYIASVLTKIINSRGLWLWRSKYLCIELVKTNRFAFYKDLDPSFATDPPAIAWLVGHPLAAQIIFGIGFFIELFAFLGLRDRLSSTILGLALIAMHLGAAWLMSLAFYHHQILCLIFLVNVPGWIICLGQRRKIASSSSL
ncbi:MAG: hypothetical protein WCN98_09245 [Verrucomicrobiaceae bacterium]